MITITQGVKVQVDAVNVPANWLVSKAAWVATIPTPVLPTYVATILSADVSGSLAKTIEVVQMTNSMAVKVLVVNGSGAAAAGIKITAYYQTTGLANNGVADSASTGSDGKAVLFLDAGTYNLLVQSSGFQDEILQSLVIQTAMVDFDQAGTKLETHVLKDNSGAVVAAAKIRVVSPTAVPLENGLIAVVTTAVDGSWTANLLPALYKFVEGKDGFDSVIAEVTIVG